jgi:SAM-dependent methyltransferase/uncharacterized protein YbaR (Trm112 family)
MSESVVTQRMTERAWHALACPYCHAALEDGAGVLTCASCQRRFPVADGRPDLRPTDELTATVEFHVGSDDVTPEASVFRVLRRRPDSHYPVEQVATDVTHRYGNRLTPELLSYFPTTSDGGLMLDLGSGDGQFADLAPGTGLDYVSMDVVPDGADVLGDAHALPFLDGSIDFVLAFSVLEHLRYPPVALHEVRRVLRPGGTFIGSVAMLEPFHLESYYHHTHLATYDGLRGAGFDVVAVAPNTEWAGVRPIAEMSLFPGAPRRVGRMLGMPLDVLSRAWWRMASRFGRARAQERRLELAGGFRFVARTPAS